MLRYLFSFVLIVALIAAPFSTSLELSKVEAASQWQNIEINPTQVPGDLTDFPIYIDLADLDVTGTDFWDTTNCTDIRVFKSDGTTELPREIVSCNTGTKTGELHVKYSGTLSSSATTTLQIHYDGSSSDYADSATYGRDNVWTGYVIVSHSENTDDSSGTGNDLTENNGIVAGDSVGELGAATEYDGINQSLSKGHNATLEPGAGDDITISVVWKADVASVRYGFVMKGNATNGPARSSYVFEILNTNRLRFVYFTAGTTNVYYADSAVSSATGWNYSVITGKYGTANSFDLYNNGSVFAGTWVAGSSANNPDTANTEPFYIGRLTTGSGAISSPMDGLIDEMRMTFSPRSANWITTEYNNWSDPAAFYFVSTEQSSGGGGATPVQSIFWFSYKHEEIQDFA